MPAQEVAGSGCAVGKARRRGGGVRPRPVKERAAQGAGLQPRRGSRQLRHMVAPTLGVRHVPGDTPGRGKAVPAGAEDARTRCASRSSAPPAKRNSTASSTDGKPCARPKRLCSSVKPIAVRRSTAAPCPATPRLHARAGLEQQRAAPPHPPQLTAGPDSGPSTSRRCSRARSLLVSCLTAFEWPHLAGSGGRVSQKLTADQSRRRAQRSVLRPQLL